MQYTIIVLVLKKNIMRLLEISKVLCFYEIPQLFVAKDAAGSKYICQVDCEDDVVGYVYISVKISDKRLNEYLQKKVDLRSIFEHPENPDHCYEVFMKDDVVMANEVPAIDPESLPEPGDFYEEE